MSHIIKNTADQWIVVVFTNATTLAPATGLTLGSITIKISQINIGVSAPTTLTTVTNNASVAEIGLGAYTVKLTQAETNCDAFVITGEYAGGTAFAMSLLYSTGTNVSAMNAGALVQIEDQVWDAQRADHVVATSFGEGTLIAPNSTVSITQLNGSSSALVNMTNFFTDNVGYHLPYSSVGNTLNGIAAAGASTTVSLDSSANGTTTDIYKNQFIRISDGTGRGQTRLITAYNAGTKVATVSPAWDVNPASGSVYVIFGAAFVNYAGSDILTQVENTVWNATVASHASAGTFGAGVLLAPTAFANVLISFPVSSGPAANLGHAISMTYQRFFGQIVTNNTSKTLVVKSNNGSTTHSTQNWTNPSSDIISLGSAS